MIAQVFFWVTMIFIILERASGDSSDTPLSLSGKTWTPKDLESIPYIPLKKRITKSEIVLTLAWTVIWVTLYFSAAEVIGIFDRNNVIPVFNEEILMSYITFVIILIVLEIIRVVHMSTTRQWTYKLAYSNTGIHVIGIVFLLMLASETNLYHDGFAPYMANLLDQPLATVKTVLNGIKWFTAIAIIVTLIIDIINGFRKAKIKPSS